MGYLKRLASQTFIYGIGIVIPRVLNYLLLTPFYTRIFNSCEYGVVTELYAYVVILLVILTYGMETGFFKFADKSNNHNDVFKTALFSLFVTSFVFLVLVFVNQKQIAILLKYSDNIEYIRWISIIVAIDAFTTIPFAKLRLLNKAKLFSLIRILEVIVNIFINLFFLYLCPKYSSEYQWINNVYNPDIGVGYVFIANLISSIVKLLLLLPFLFIRSGKVDFVLLKKMLVYCLPLLIAGMAGTVNEALDRILLKHLLKEDALSQLGIYGANYKLAVLMTLFVQMFRFAAEPFYFSEKETVDAKEKYAEVMKYFIFSGMVIFLIVINFLDFFILFIGENFREGVKIVPVVLLANLFMGIFNNMSIWFKITGNTKYGAFFVITGAIITVIINVLFIPYYGYYASAWGHLISYTIMIIICFYYGNIHYKIPYNLKKIFVLIFVPFVLVFLHKLICFENHFLTILFGLLLIGAYVSFFMKIEKIKFTSIWK